MDFNDTPEEARFREEASSWLAENAPTDDAFRALSPLEQAKVWQKEIRCRLGLYRLGARLRRPRRFRN